MKIIRWTNESHKESRKDWMIRLLNRYGKQNPKKCSLSTLAAKQ
jgi:hypothetical protein